MCTRERAFLSKKKEARQERKKVDMTARRFLKKSDGAASRFACLRRFSSHVWLEATRRSKSTGFSTDSNRTEGSRLKIGDSRQTVERVM